MSIKKFWKSKKLWTALTLIGIGVFIYYYFFSEEKIILSEKEEKEEIEEQYKEDKDEPYSQIKSPINGSWQNKTFKIHVLDEDLGSGIKEGSCQYKVYSFSLSGEENSSGWKNRKCNDYQTISVGPEGKCFLEGRSSCWIYVRSQDKAGNWYTPSKQEMSIQYYGIDWTNPYIGKVVFEEKNEGYKATIETTDVLKITGCLLYIDGESQGSMNFLNEECYNECFLEKNFTLSGAGEHDVYAYCRDLAGNWGKGETTQVTINTPPVISSCKSLPTSGDRDTEIQFAVTTEDIDNDVLSFFWDFGDNTSSQEERPTHVYSKNGTYTPTVTVSDGKGEEVSCSTAWITIVEQ